jgi:hypothetical protein
LARLSASSAVNSSRVGFSSLAVEVVLIRTPSSRVSGAAKAGAGCMLPVAEGNEDPGVTGTRGRTLGQAGFKLDLMPP